MKKGFILAISLFCTLAIANENKVINYLSESRTGQEQFFLIGTQEGSLMTEFSRILRKGGQAVLHHSNAREHSNFEADTNWRKNPHWRSEFNAKDMAHIAHKSGFVVEEQIFADWEIEALDCITVLKKC